MPTLLETTRSGRRAVLAALAGVATLGRVRPAAAQRTRSVRFAFFGTGAEQRAFQHLATAFEAVHPDVTVELVGLDSGDASLQLDTLLTSPDRPWLQRGGPYQSWLWRKLQPDGAGRLCAELPALPSLRCTGNPRTARTLLARKHHTRRRGSLPRCT